MKQLEIQVQNSRVARKVARNSFFLFSSTSLGIITRLSLIPIVARYLGIELFGFYSLILAISMSITPIANFGFETILCRELSKQDVEGDIYFSTTVITKSCLSLLLVLIAVLTLMWFSPWKRPINIALIIAITEQLGFSMAQTYLAAIRAFERMEFDILANFIHKTALFIFVLGVVIFDLGFINIFYARLLSSAIYLMGVLILTYRIFIKPRLAFVYEYGKHVIKESYPVAVYMLLLTLIFKVDVFLLEWFGSEKDIALFEGPHRFASQMQILATSISFAIFPVLSRSSKENWDGSLNEYYRITYKVLFITGVLLGCMLFIGGEPLTVIIFGHEFRDAAICLQIMSPIVLFLFIIILQTSLLIAINKQVQNTISIGVALAINIVLDILLIPPLAYVGASIATVISYLILMLISADIVRKESVILGLGGDILKTVLVGSMMCSFVFLELQNEFVSVILRGIGAFCMYIFLLYRLQIISRDEIRAIKGLFRRERGLTIKNISDREVTR